MLKGPLPIYCTDEVEEVIRQAFAYAFHPAGEELPAGMLPKLEFRRIDERPFEVLGERFTPIPLSHGRFNVFGFRIGDVAYCTDVSAIPERSWPLLEGLKVFIIDALRPTKPHPSHFSLEEALEAIARVQPGAGVPDAHVAHDGLRCTCPHAAARRRPGIRRLEFRVLRRGAR